LALRKNRTVPPNKELNPTRGRGLRAFYAGVGGGANLFRSFSGKEKADLIRFLVVSAQRIRIADPTLRREVREVLAQHGINGNRLRVGTHKEPIRVRGNKAKHLFDMSIRVNHNEDFIRCISFDVEHYSSKLDAAKALIYDCKDIKTVNTTAEVISILYPPKTHEGETPKELFAEAQGILRDEKVHPLVSILPKKYRN
jgi:hypothetical protein